jgi:hypothetical protein
MKVARGILCVIVLGALFAVCYGNSKRQRQGWFPFYKAGVWGLCTLPTIIPYTTNIVDAIEFTPIIQNLYYTTEVFTQCPTTVIYKADFDETVIN